jgi:hypothetical protein
LRRVDNCQARGVRASGLIASFGAADVCHVLSPELALCHRVERVDLLRVTIEKTDASREELELLWSKHVEDGGKMHPLHYGDFVSRPRRRPRTLILVRTLARMLIREPDDTWTITTISLSGPSGETALTRASERHAARLYRVVYDPLLSTTHCYLPSRCGLWLRLRAVIRAELAARALAAPWPPRNLAAPERDGARRPEQLGAGREPLEPASSRSRDATDVKQHNGHGAS